MRKKVYEKRLALKKQTVAHLDPVLMEGVKGGTGGMVTMVVTSCLPTVSIGDNCVTRPCNAPTTEN